MKVKHISLTSIAKRVAAALNHGGFQNGGASPRTVIEVMVVVADGIGREAVYGNMTDARKSLKVLYGSMFAAFLKGYSHWGWIDTDAIVGDMAPLVAKAQFYDIVTFLDPVRARLDHAVQSQANCSGAGRFTCRRS